MGNGIWAPSPKTQSNSKDWLAGYSDAYHGYRYGSGHDSPTSAYRDGYSQAKSQERDTPNG